jgi:hypothetical protein
MIEEEEPRAVRTASVNLHSVVVDLDRVALPVRPGDDPLRARHGEVAALR